MPLFDSVTTTIGPLDGSSSIFMPSLVAGGFKDEVLCPITVRVPLHLYQDCTDKPLMESWLKEAVEDAVSEWAARTDMHLMPKARTTSLPPREVEST